MISNRLVQLFADVVTLDVGPEKIPARMAGNHLSPTSLEKDSLSKLDGIEAAKVSASFQQALCLFYGRGARGILLRVGQSMWEKLVVHANFREKADLEIARRFPVPVLARRRMLNLVAGYFREGGGATSVHTLDLDLLLVDNSAAATVGQITAEPICFVTLGLIQGASL